jgi:hypothetical protein
VCCKFAIQDFVKGIHKKKEILTVSPMATPTAYNPLVFHKELKKIYGIVPQSPTAIPMDFNPSVFHRELKKIYWIVPQSPRRRRLVVPGTVWPKKSCTCIITHL